MSFFSFAQTKDELDLCMAIQANSFTSNTEAENALDRILDVIGASKNFVLTPCDKISNAVATAYKGTRYILYDREFMNLISKNTNDWSNLFIFAHEVGHHINGHSIDLLLYTNDVVDAPSLEKSRKQELEADEFAAFVLAKLGANLSQLNNVITLISDNSDDTYSTHPKRDKRLASVRIGFNKGYTQKGGKTLYTDTNIGESVFADEENLVKYGNWLVSKTTNDDPFIDDKIVAYGKGKIIGNNPTFKVAPRFVVKIPSKQFEAPKFLLEFANENDVKKYFGDWSITYCCRTYKGADIRIEIKVVDLKGKEISSDYRNIIYTSNPNSKQENNLFYLNKLSGSIYRKLTIDELKKGSKLFIKLSGNYGEFTYFKNGGRPSANITRKIAEFENLIFEYSLNGSSKALAD